MYIYIYIYMCVCVCVCTQPISMYKKAFIFVQKLHS